ncbi:Uma2 family endonuclease, partial [Microcoleus sp. F10-C6]|uniref:Uma2 family endonuclease n=1 Tax=unclassified Microcoleus TaxID=2642155 RepID=UPI002FD53984
YVNTTFFIFVFLSSTIYTKLDELTLVKLGWLINRKTRRVEIYRQGQEVEILESPAELSGEDVLPGFVLNLQLVWQ